jgi:excisionase family DNA binding protein
MTSDDNLFLTAEEVSQYLRIPVSTVYKLVQDSVLPAFRVGKHWRFRKTALEEWVRKQELQSLSE